MTEEQIIEAAIQGHASTRDAIRWAMNQVRKDAEPVAYEAAVVRQLVDALRMVMDEPDALDGRPRTYECVQEALAAAKEARL